MAFHIFFLHSTFKSTPWTWSKYEICSPFLTKSKTMSRGKVCRSRDCVMLMMCRINFLCISSYSSYREITIIHSRENFLEWWSSSPLIVSRTPSSPWLELVYRLFLISCFYNQRCLCVAFLWSLCLGRILVLSLDKEDYLQFFLMWVLLITQLSWFEGRLISCKPV